MELLGWKKDAAGKLYHETNAVFVKRRKWTAGNKVYEMWGTLYLDLMRQSRFLISQTDIRLLFLPAKPEFSLVAIGDDGCKIRFNAISLYVCHMLLNLSVINCHADGLNKYDAPYSANHMGLITFIICRGQQIHVNDRLFPYKRSRYWLWLWLCL